MQIWILLAILSPFLMSFTNLMEKFLVDKKIKHHAVIPFFGGIVSAILGILIFIFHGFVLLPVSQVCVLLLSGILLIVYLLPYFEALAIDDSSRVVPLFQFAPVFVVLLSSLLLKEHLTAHQMIAFMFIIFGGFLLGMEKSDLTIFKPRKSMVLILISSLIVSFVGVLFKFAYVTGDFITTLAYQSIGSGIGAVLLLLVPTIRRGCLSEYKRLQGQVLAILVFNKLLEFVGELTSLVAITIAPVALVTVFSGLQPFFLLIEVILLSRWLPHILEEDISKEILAQKFISLLLIFIGIYILSQ